MSEPKPEGWGGLVNSRKWHYFKGIKSLCGRWMCLSLVDLEQGNDDSPSNCAACRKKLKKLQEKEKKKIPHANVKGLEI